MTTATTTPKHPIRDVIPEELTKLHRWVGHRSKIPYDAHHEAHKASSTDSKTWSCFDRALSWMSNHGGDGIGFVFNGDGIIGVDLDKCRDPGTERIKPKAQKIIDRLNSYTEVSPSGTGVHIILRGELPGKRRRIGNIEMYSTGRYFCMSGHHLPNTPNTIKDRSEELADFYRKTFEKEAISNNVVDTPTANRKAPTNSVEPDDETLIEKAKAANNGDSFRALWGGDINGHGSPSEADLALCSHLAFWTGNDPARIDLLFRRSGLMRTKWDREDYRDRTIQTAIAGNTKTYQAGPGPIIRSYTNIERRPVEWLWQDRLPAYKINLIAGAGGLGKSYLTLDLAARISAGRSWVDSRDTPNPAGDVIIVSCEDDPEDTIATRLDLLGADSRRIFQFDGVRRPEAKGGVSMFDLSRDMRHIEATLDRLPEVKLIIIDPLGGHLGRDCDSHRDADVRGRLSPLAEMASRRRVTILGVVHLAKADQPGATAMTKVLGSVGFVNQARAVWMLFRDRGVPGRRLLLPAKNNLAPMDVGGLAFEITDKGLVWEADPVSITADEMVSRDRARMPVDDARDWLKDYLKDGPRDAKVAEQEAEGHGFAPRTVRRARKQLGVVFQRKTGTWLLPQTRRKGE